MKRPGASLGKIRPRLLLVVPLLDSVEAFLTGLLTALEIEGVEVHVAAAEAGFSSRGASGGGVAGAAVHKVAAARGFAPLAHLHGAHGLRAVVRTVAPDLVHAHFSATIFTTALARRANWPSTLGTFQGLSFPFSTGLRRCVLRLAEGWSAARLTQAWVLTADDAAALRRTAPRAHVRQQASLGFGCDLRRFDPLVVRNLRREARKTLRIPEEAIVFTFVGRFTEFKGFHLVAKAHAEIPGDRRTCLLLVGAPDPYHSTGVSAAELRRMEGAPNVRIVGWSADVRHQLAATDVVILPSRREGMAVSLMEALAAGIPAVTSNARGCREVVRDDVDGLLLSRLSVESVRNAMLRLAGDASLRQRLAEGALAGRTRFDRAHYVDEQVEVYLSLLKRHGLQ